MNRAGVLVVFDNGNVIQSCVEFSESELSGVELLRRAGFTLVTDASYGLGEAVCKIDGLGCDFPGEHCFCECMGAPCNYWGYWNRKNGAWVYSGQGGSNHKVGNGDVDAWVWGNDNSRPPDVGWESLCATPTETPTTTETSEPSATYTPQHTATHTATRTATPEPSKTSTPTATNEAPTETATPSHTPQPPTATFTPYGVYAEGTYTAVVIVTTHTPYVNPTSTATSYPTLTPKPTWTLRPTSTAIMTALVSPSVALLPSSTHGAYPAPVMASPPAAPALPQFTAQPLQSSPAAIRSDLQARVVASPQPPQVMAQEQPAISQDSAQPTLAPRADDGRGAQLLAQSVLRGQITPTPAPRAARQVRRSYGVFLALALLLLLLIGYAAQVRRQRQERELGENAQD